MSAVSLRSARMRAVAPRAILYVLVGILCLAGLRAALTGPPEAAPASTAPPPSVDIGVQAFAEAFARSYLSWDAANLEPRERALATFMSDDLDEDGGLIPRGGSSQDVDWTAAVGTQPSGSRSLVTVAAQTSDGLKHVTVPVSRDGRGFLYVSAYPALIGPPATNVHAEQETEDEVEQEPLVVVAERAVRNYLNRSVANLRADLTPGAVVSLPAEPMRVDETSQVTWVNQPNRVAVEVEASQEGNTWTLRYELEVTKSDRWYVRSLQVDPTFKEEQ